MLAAQDFVALLGFHGFGRQAPAFEPIRQELLEVCILIAGRFGGGLGHQVQDVAGYRRIV